MNPAVPEFAELQAPQSWGTVDFISDLHLCESQPATFDAWQRYMHGTSADAVFILGDLFEVWVGDDIVRPDVSAPSTDLNFEERCALVLQAAGRRLDLFFMHGNRDFLVGSRLMTTCNAHLLADPTVLTFDQQRYLLSHGDMLCLADTRYLAFRNIVRQPLWQQEQLAKPLAERQAIGRQMRLESQKNQHHQRSDLAYADVDDRAAIAWLHAAGAMTMIHGHTHKPANHDLGSHLSRVVMTDWDLSAAPARAQVLRLTAGSLQRIQLD
ncbi:MAG: UDP-2,3-diacylglucosamine diphosphatase [Burkholderiaceae bacterium]|nr:UDP-2,3-diacylglucosamine diphosphatase [Burkholderiaceae bacterium]